MKLALPPVPQPHFTLASALRWLGYDDQSRHCPHPLRALPASVWFLKRRGQQAPTFPLETLLIVDPIATGAPAAVIRRMIDDVNGRTGSNLIVLARQACRIADPVTPVALHPDDPAGGGRAPRRLDRTSHAGTRSLPHLGQYPLSPTQASPLAPRKLASPMTLRTR
jgi:hypothetical protein